MPRPTSTLLLTLLALAGACASVAQRALPRPLGTEHHLDEQAEERAREQRRRWIVEQYRSADDPDCRTLERENGLREQGRRNALAAQAGTAESALSAWAEWGSSHQAGRTQVALFSPDLIGKDRCCQVWCRDPLHPDCTGVGLSDALRATFGS